MNPEVCEIAIGDALERELSPHRFVRHRQPLDFIRSAPSLVQTLRFGVRFDEQAVCQLSGTVGLVFEAVERILKGNDYKTDSLTPTIVVPLHLLHPTREYFEWPIASDASIVSSARAIAEYTRAHALPFLERHKNIEDLRAALSSGDPRDWFVLTAEQRVMILAASAYLSGSRDEALRLLDAALLERRDALPKRRYPIEQLRARLA